MRVLLVLFTLAFALSANEVVWLHSYKDAVIKSKAENKPILVIMTKEHCRWCKRLETRTLEDETIKERLSDKFINLVLVRESSEFPGFLKARIFPTSFFLTKEERVIHKMPGFWKVDDFNSIIDDALMKYKKLK